MNSSTPLPSREGNWPWVILAEAPPAAASVLEAFVAKDLMTAEEWRATIDYEAAGDEAELWAKTFDIDLPRSAIRAIGITALDAAFGDTTDE